jgi:hypothetical protein
MKIVSAICFIVCLLFTATLRAAEPFWGTGDVAAYLGVPESSVRYWAWMGTGRRIARLLNRADKKGWKIVVLDVDVDTSTAAGRLVVDVVSAAAQFESKRIGERVRDAHAVRKAQGKRAGQAPILPQHIRTRIYQDHVAGKSLAQIARDLDAEGVPTAKGGKWHPYTVSQVIDSVKLDVELAALADRTSSPLE